MRCYAYVLSLSWRRMTVIEPELSFGRREICCREERKEKKDVGFQEDRESAFLNLGKKVAVVET